MGDDEEELEDVDENVEEELLWGEFLLLVGIQCVCLVYFDVKWGLGKLQMI